MAVEALKETIVAGLEQTHPAKMGLETLVFGKAISATYDTEVVQADMFDGTRGEAGYTARGAKGQTVGLDGWTTESHKPPLIDENFVVTAQDLKIRGFGEGNINTRNHQKFQNIVNRQLLKLKNRKQRTYNKQIAELITAGTVTVVEKDDKGAVLATRTIDFKMPAAHIYTVATAWNAAGADIFGDMRAIDNLVVKASGLKPTYAIVGETTLADIIADSNTQTLLDNRRINFGELAQEDRGNGLTFWGMLYGKAIYTFTDFDSSGSVYIPASAYIVGNEDAELDVMYGSIDAMVNGVPTVVESEEVIANTTDDEAVSSKFAFKSAKLFALTQSGAFGHLTTR